MPVTRLTLNNLGDVTEQDVYAGNGYALSSFSSGGPSGMLREKTPSLTTPKIVCNRFRFTT